MLKRVLGAVILLVISAWAVSYLGMLLGFPEAARAVDRLQKCSGLEAWFPPLYWFPVPAVLICTLGLMHRRSARR